MPSAVVPAIDVAACATQVPVAREACIRGVVEELLAEQHLGAEFLGRDGRYGHQLRDVPLAVGLQIGEIVDADCAIHEVVDEQRQPVGRNREALGSRADVKAEQFAVGMGIDDHDLAA